MAKAEATTAAARAPRGTKPVAQAFLTALDAIPEATRPAVAKAAQAMIRDELKNRRDKLKAAAAKEKEKARPSAPSGRTRKSAAPDAAEQQAETTAVKRRSRKRTDVPAAA